MKTKLFNRTILRSSATILLGLSCVLCMSACKNTKPEINSFDDVSDQNSILLNAVKCDESINPADNWVWTSKGIGQRQKDGYEFVLCTMYGYYEINDNQYWGSLRYSIDKYNEKTILNQEMVTANFLPNGYEINSPDFNNVTDKPMLENCIQNSEEFTCLVAVQYDLYTILRVRMDGHNLIPLEITEKLVNSALILEDSLIRKYLVP